MIKVFLVEDEIVIREGLQRMIPWGEYGFELVGEAGDGEIALPVIREKKPDILITDIKMPFMDGLDLCKIVKKELPSTKIIIVSGYDDFDYAQQAISLGVESYLLKPISKLKFIEVLQEIRTKCENENLKRTYYNKFKNEIQEYEQLSRRDFFDTLVSGQVNLRTLYEKAEKLQLDITAQAYNIVLFSMNSIGKDNVIQDGYTQETAWLQNHLDQLFSQRKEYLLFRNQIFSYAVLIKGEKNRIHALTLECAETLKTFFHEGGDQIEWFICDGTVVERLSMLSESYQEAMHKFAARYLSKYRRGVYSADTPETDIAGDEMKLKNIDTNMLNPEIIHNFLSKALPDEVNDFAKNYLNMIGEEALKSKIFRQYILLNVHFSTVSFIQKLGYDKSELDQFLAGIVTDPSATSDYGENQIKKILKKGIQVRDESTKGRYKSVLESAITFIEKNYTDDSISLNKVACAANVSANHFSALFSQEMKKTFIEYLTELRMDKAKQLLRCTDKRSGEIAMEVGYKDSHYFSFLFKKTQGITPSDYRSKKGGVLCAGEVLVNRT
ncbi:response regulator [Anaerocolumna sp. AGMB13025]|uniref:response regulator n=1 Tax=Anaerocolumna sp. AGMB13025 TaxID=3039116 RepID=UPI00241F83D7|nr:response regulator [Anaerocolumna sp. AGMB13025]WFR55042.1 response regulator [Anaerocolumna sp. AGMB13025]